MWSKGIQKGEETGQAEKKLHTYQSFGAMSERS
jgi:hypothetical protein